MTGKVNGGVMRIAPVGLFPKAGEDTVFELGCEAAGMTHGHSNWANHGGCVRADDPEADPRPDDS